MDIDVSRFQWSDAIPDRDGHGNGDASIPITTDCRAASGDDIDCNRHAHCHPFLDSDGDDHCPTGAAVCGLDWFPPRVANVEQLRTGDTRHGLELLW